MLNEVKINKIVLGTIAITDFNLTKQILEKFGKEKVILAIDCKFKIGIIYLKLMVGEKRLP